MTTTPSFPTRDRRANGALGALAPFGIVGFLILFLAGNPALAAEPGEPIELAYVEGDVAGTSALFSEDGKSSIGFIEYRQHRRENVLEIMRIAHFKDGTSDEDRVEAEVGKTLRAVRGRSVIRDAKGIPVVDIAIDVAGGRIKGFYGTGEDRENFDEKVELPAGTYWGPLLGIVLKNFEQNQADGRLVFRTVVPTPKPRVFDMEFTRQEQAVVSKPGGKVDVVRFSLTPTFNFLVDPILRMITPKTSFFMQPGEPPAFTRFDGPRNYAGAPIRIE